jgi:thymidine phosphorylase
LFHARRGALIAPGQPIATLYATNPALLPEPVALMKQAILISETPPVPVALVSRIFTRETAEAYLREARK